MATTIETKSLQQIANDGDILNSIPPDALVYIEANGQAYATTWANIIDKLQTVPASAGDKVQVTTSGSKAYSAGVMVDIIQIQVNTGGLVKIGTTPGGDEMFSATLATNQNLTYPAYKHFNTAGTLYFTAPNAIFKLYKRIL